MSKAVAEEMTPAPEVFVPQDRTANFVPAKESASPRDAFRAAFESAKAEHAEPVTAATVEAEDDEPETPAAVVTEPVETPAAVKVESGLISDDEFATLQKAHANDPAALRKSLEGAFTKKTQKLAEERTSLERLRGYVPLIDSYEQDAEGTLRQLAEANGFDLVVKGERPAAAPVAPTEQSADQVMAEFRTALGPELEYLADSLAPAITKMVDRLTQSTVEQKIAPLRTQNTTLLNQAAAEQTNVVMKSFEAKHPDWKTHEPAMLALAKKISPNGMTEGEYLEHLHTTVSRAAWEADREANIEREVSGRFKKRVAKMDTGASEATTPAVPESQVRKRPEGPVSFSQAYQDAKAGIVYED